MGRGNVCVRGKYEGLYFVDWDNFSDEFEDEDGNIIKDYDMQRDEFEDSLFEFVNDFKKKYNSFNKCDKWIDRSIRAILESKLFYIAVEDNEWSMAFMLIQKEQDYYDNYNFEGLQAGLYQKYLNGMKECLFNQFNELGTYSGAWTSGTIKRRETA